MFETLKALEAFKVAPFETGYEESPVEDFVGRSGGWEWPEEDAASKSVMSHEAIHLGDSHDFVQIEVLERGTLDGRNEGDLRLGVSVRCGTFAGSYDHVWIAKADWSSFLASMRRLERERNGQASLVSMSPDEFELHLQGVDRAGHLAAHGCLSRHHSGHPPGKTTRSRIEYHIDIDPSLLRELVLSLEALGQPAVK